MLKRKRTYTEEFKKDAIDLALKSPTILAAAEGLGIPKATLTSWVKGNQVASKLKPTDDINEELIKLRKENARLKEEREILKKAATFFVKEQD